MGKRTLIQQQAVELFEQGYGYSTSLKLTQAL